MRKMILSALIAGFAFTANAQEQGLSYSKFFDNWQVGLKAGAGAPTTHEAFIKNSRLVFGAEVGKQLSPGFRLGLEGVGYVNPVDLEANKTAIDRSVVSLLGTFNFSNIFGGYKGAPRFFEVEGFAGPAWDHIYVADADDFNSLAAKFGANLLFNFGQNKAWGVKITPSITYDVNSPSYESPKSANNLNIERSWTDVTVGIVYRFKGSNGAHHFTSMAGRNQGEIDGLNSNVSNLRNQLNSKDEQLRAAQQRAAQLEKELEAARNQKPEVRTVTKTNNTLESVVTFGVGKSTVDASQLPNVERIATYLKKYPNSRVVIKGYASPEGNQEKNIALANARAEAVKKVLMARYKIDSNRISAQGNGIGDMFSEPEWNRVSIATIEENK